MPQARPIFTTIELAADDVDDVMSNTGRRFSFVGLFTRRGSATPRPTVEITDEQTATAAVQLHFSHKVGKKGQFKELTHVALQPPRASRFATGRSQLAAAMRVEPTVLCLSESGNNCIQALDLKSSQQIDKIVSRSARSSGSDRDSAAPKGETLIMPRGIVCDARSGGVVYIVEWAGERVQKVRLTDGACLAVTKGAKLKYPEAVALHGERLYVTDTGNHRVVVLDAESLKVRATSRNPSTPLPRLSMRGPLLSIVRWGGAQRTFFCAVPSICQMTNSPYFTRLRSVHPLFTPTARWRHRCLIASVLAGRAGRRERRHSSKSRAASPLTRGSSSSPTHATTASCRCGRAHGP